MKICITPESLALFNKFFADRVPKLITDKASKNQILKSLYTEAFEVFGGQGHGLKEKELKEVVLQHLIAVPTAVKQYFSSNPLEASKHQELEKEFNDLNLDIIHAAESKGVIGIVAKLINELANQQQVVQDNDFDGSPDFISESLFKTYFQYNKNDNFEFKGQVTDEQMLAMKYIARKVSKLSVEKGYKLKFVLKSNILSALGEDVVDLTNSLDQYVLVPVDANGEYVKFNSLGDATSNGKIALFPIVQDGSLSATADFIPQQKRLTQFFMEKGSTEKEAIQLAKDEIARYNAFLGAAIKKINNNEDVFLDIDPSKGTEKYDSDFMYSYGFDTIQNFDELNFSIKLIPASGNGKEYFKTVFTTPNSNIEFDVQAKAIKDVVSPEQIDAIAELLFRTTQGVSNFAKRNVNGQAKDISLSEVGNLIYSLIPFSSGKFAYTSSKGKAICLVNGTNILENASIESIKNSLEQYINTPALVNTQQQNAPNTVNASDDLNVSSLKHRSLIKGAVNKLVSFPSCSSLNNRGVLMTDKEVVTGIKDGVVQTQKISAKEYISKNYTSCLKPNANNELLTYSDFISFQSRDIAEDSALSTEGLDDVNWKSHTSTPNDSFINTESEAYKWLMNSPLSKMINIQLIEQVSERGPNFVASYVNGLMKFYLGSVDSDIYHEAFHIFTENILTQEEKDDLYNSIRNVGTKLTTVVSGKSVTVNSKEADDTFISEWLANNFQDKADAGSLKTLPKVKAFFEKVRNILKAIFGTMTMRDAIQLNKLNGITSTLFNAVYSGKISGQFANSNPIELYKSAEADDKKDVFNLQETKTLMDSIGSIIGESLSLALDKALTDSDQKTKFQDLFNATRQPLDSPEYNSSINRMSLTPVYSGLGISLLQNNLGAVSTAMKYVKLRLEQQLAYYKKLDSNNPSLLNTYAIDLIEKALKPEVLGSLEQADLKQYIDKNETDTLFGLYLNNYSFFGKVNNTNIEEQKEDDIQDLVEETNSTNAVKEQFDDLSKDVVTQMNEVVRSLVSNIHAYEHNGVGNIKLNDLGFRKNAVEAVIARKLQQHLSNMTSQTEMLLKLKEVSKTDKEIAQVLGRLGDFTLSTANKDIKLRWNSFFQHFCKASTPLLGFGIEKTLDAENNVVLNSLLGKFDDSIKEVGKKWEANFKYVLENSKYTKEVEKSIRVAGIPTVKTIKVLDLEKMQESEEWNKADRFGKLAMLGINMVKTPIVSAAINGAPKDLDFEFDPKAVSKIIDIINNRIDSGDVQLKELASLKDLFNQGFYYEGMEQRPQSQLFTQLQTLEYNYSDEYISFMRKNAEGEKQSERTYHSSLTKLSSMLNKVKNLEELKNTAGLEQFNPDINPAVLASRDFRLMFNLDEANKGIYGTRNQKFKVNVNFIAGFKIIDSKRVQEGETTEEDTVVDNVIDKGSAAFTADAVTKLISDIHMTLNNQQEVLRSEAKSTSPAVFISKEIPFGLAELKQGNYFEHLKNYLSYEILRQSKINNVKEKIRAGDLIVGDPTLMNDGQGFAFFDDMLRMNDTLSAKVKALIKSDYQFEDINTLPTEIQDLFSEVAQEYFEKLTNQTYNEFADKLVLTDALKDKFKEGEETSEELHKKIVMLHEVNSFLGNLNYCSMFLGDPFIYKLSSENFHKRIAGFISGGLSFNHDSYWMSFLNSDEIGGYAFGNKNHNKQRKYTGELNTAIIEDIKPFSAYVNEYKKAGIATKEYEEMTEPDGFGVISFDAYRLLNMSCDEWSQEQEKLYQKILNGESIQFKDVAETFPMRKFQYYGNVRTDRKSIDLGHVAFHKYSLMPIIPGLYEGKVIDKLHDDMMQQDIDYAVFVSGSKLTSFAELSLDGDKFKGKLNQPYTNEVTQDGEQTVNNREYKSETFIKNTIHVSSLKNQIYLKPGFKGKIKLSSQLVKKVLDGLASDGNYIDAETKAIGEKYDALWKDYKQTNMKFLLEDLGITYNTHSKQFEGSTAKLVEYLKQKLAEKELLPEEVAYIINPTTNELIEDLSFSLHGGKINELLTQIIDKKLRNIKVKGEALVQAPHVFQEVYTYNGETGVTSKGEYTSTNGLKFYHKVDENGDPVTDENGKWKISKMEVKVALQGDFFKLLNLKHPDGNKIKVENDDVASLKRLNEAIKDKQWNKENEKALTLSGVRIPAQGPNSLEAVTIGEFMPPHFGAHIFLPSEIVAKAGSDFDIDKLFCMFPSISIRNGKAIIPTFKKSNKSKAELKSQVREAKEEYVSLIQKQKEQFKNVTDFSAIGDNMFDYYVSLSERLNQELKDGVEDSQIEDTKQVKGQAWEQVQRANNLSKEQREALKQTEAAINIAKEKYNSLLTEKEGYSIDALNNDLLNLFTERITHKKNFVDLLTANTTDLFVGDGGLVDDMRKRTISSYNKRINSKGELQSTISNATPFTYRYNLSKQQENSVGMDTLGILAVASSFFSIFTVTGASLKNVTPAMQQKYTEALNEISAGRITEDAVNTLKESMPLLQFNLNKNSTGAISISNQKNINGHLIADIFSQLINGAVDVAKDAWIFDIQGTKENIPALITMVMMGMNVSDAIYLSCNPLVMAYNKIKKESIGVFTKLTNDLKNTEIVSPVKLSNKEALEKLQQQYKDILPEVGEPIWKKILLESEGLESKLYSLVSTPIEQDSLNHLKALANYLEIERYSTDITALTMATKFDTQKNKSVVDAQSRMDAVESIQRKESTNYLNLNPKTGVMAKLLQSPLGQFNFDKLIVELFNNKFGLRNNDVLNSMASSVRMKGENPSVVRTQLQDDFLWFLYQNSFYNNQQYRSGNGPILPIEYSDKHTIVQFSEDGTKILSPVGEVVAAEIMLMPVHLRKYFKDNTGAYAAFKAEYEVEENTMMDELDLNTNMTPIDYLQKKYPYLYTGTYNANEFLARIALYKTQNNIAMFSDTFGYARVFQNILALNPDLVKYDLCNHLKASIDSKNELSNLSIRNLKDNPELIPIYKENLTTLQNHEDPFVADFFNKLSHYAIMQTGMNRSSEYDLGRLADPTMFESVVRNGLLSEVQKQVYDIRKKANELKLPMNDVIAGTLFEQFRDAFMEMKLSNSYKRLKGYNYTVNALKLSKEATKTQPKDFELVLGLSTDEYVNHSGGAKGFDSVFDSVGRDFGFNNHVHYFHSSGAKPVLGNKPLTNDELSEGIEKVTPTYSQLLRAKVDKYLPLHGRNWFQVKNADAVFAVSNILKPGETGTKEYKNGKQYPNKSLFQIVEGGTGYAVQMAINEGKRVYVYHQATKGTTMEKGWYTWNGSEFEKTETPTLTKNYAGIGSSTNITDDGKQAVRDLFANTKEQITKPKFKELLIEDLKPKEEFINIESEDKDNIIDQQDILSEKLGLTVEEKEKAIVNFGEKYKKILFEKELTAEEYIDDVMNSGNTVLIDKVIELIKKCHNG